MSRSFLYSRPAASAFVALFALLTVPRQASAQPTTFGGNSQHTSLYVPAVQDLNRIRWSTTIDQNNTGAFAHYGAPLITLDNTVITPVKIANDGFLIEGHNGSDGSLMYTLTTDYVLPSHNWIPAYQPVIARGTFGLRLWYPGKGGSVFYVDSIGGTPTPPTRIVFYNPLGLTNSDTDATVFVDTPITADSAGNVYFGFRIDGTSTTLGNQSGYVKIDTNGKATYRFVGALTNDPNVFRDCHNTAPALSNDEGLLYVVAKGSDAYHSYLLALNTTDLNTASQVFLIDPRNGNPAGVLDDGTASPMVAPDGDVYFGIFANPSNGSRGFLDHFNSNLTTSYTVGEFGWDSTAAIVPAGMVPSYTGTSSYLLFCKYNNYDIDDGNGVNRVAILDPHSTQIDFHPSAPGLQEMREVLTMIGPTADVEASASYPTAVREWCVNTGAVDPSTDSVLFDSEDGHIYRWNLSNDSLDQVVQLTSGIGEPYVPTTIGPDGTAYTLNGGNLFALGNIPGQSMSLATSEPDTRTALASDTITFTATLGGGSGTRTGTVTFTDLTYNGHTPVTTTLGVIPVDAGGHASVSTSGLSVGGAFLGNHFITASYSGDPGFAAESATLVQKVHSSASTTTLTSSANPSGPGSNVTFTANCVGADGGIPGGYVTFSSGSTIFGQVALDASGNASANTNALAIGNQPITATYVSDTYFAASAGTLTQAVQETTSTAVSVSPTSGSFGQTITYTATVTAADAGAGTPPGSVTFSDGATNIGSMPLNSSGVATLTVSNFQVGSHIVTGTYSGPAGWQGSSGTAPAVAISDGSTTAVAGAPNPSTYGQSVTLTATISPADVGAGTPAGSVTFMDGAASLGSSPVDGSGHATLSTSSLTMGSHSITATFAGTGGWGGSSGGTSQNVQDGTSTTVSGSPNPSSLGQSVTFTAAVVAANAGAGTPSGTVTFTAGATNLGSAPVDGTGHASVSTSTLSFGIQTITVSFVGTNGFLNSSGSTSQNVTDVTAPSIPSGVAAVGGPGRGQITVHWSASTDPDDPVASYRVFRSNKLNGSYSQVATITGLTFTDSVGKGQTRYYFIESVDSHGNVSGPSAKVFAKAP